MYNVYVSMRHTPLSTYYASWLAKGLGSDVRIYDGFDRIRSGEFPADLVMRIRQCKNFLVILTPETFGQDDDNTSWMAYEIEAAIQEHANIIILQTQDFIWPKKIPDRIADLPRLCAYTVIDDHDCWRRISLLSHERHEIRSNLLPCVESHYDVFISFKSEDAPMAERLYDYCKRIRKVPFWSKRTLPELSQSEYEDAIYEALRKAKHFIVVLSNLDYLSSPWVQREMKAFDRAITEGRKPDGNFIFVVTDEVYDQIICSKKMCLDERYCGYQILKLSEYEEALLYYLS